jgi:phage shock protein A
MPEASVTGFDPLADRGVGRDPSLERRVQRLEEEVKALRSAVEKLRKQRHERRVG